LALPFWLLPEATVDRSADVADPKAPGADLIDMLLAQHSEIIAELNGVELASGAERAAAMRTLAGLIELHESIEADVVRPLTRRYVTDGEAIAHARFVEEDQISELLERLSTMNAADARFADAFAVFRDVFACHMHREEAEEFAPLRAQVARQELLSRAVAARRIARR
jgi:Hemerythrin HHE cation binding domain